jgi:hypothetical protein
MKKIIYLVILCFFFTKCKDSTIKSPVINDELVSKTKTIIDNIDKMGDDSIVTNSNQKNIWSFYKISENPLVNLNDMTRDEIFKQFKEVKIQIDETIFKVDKYCSFEPYISRQTTLDYFSNNKTVKIYKNELSKNGIKLTDNITVYQSLYPEKECKNPSGEYFVTDDDVLIFSYQGYLLFFKKGNEANTENNNCYINTKITNLPITKEIINSNNVWNELDCSVANLETKDYIRLPNINEVKVFIIGNFNYDDFIYSLVTIKNGKVITVKDIGFAKSGEDGNSISKLTEFEVSKDFIFTLDTKSRKGDDFKIEKQEKFEINENGLVVKEK